MAAKQRRPTIADLDDKPGHLIRRAHQLSLAIFEAKTGAYGVTASQPVVMTALFTKPGVDQATLAALVALDKVTVGHILTRLEKRGLVERSLSETDRRARVIMLSERGRRMLEEMQDAVRQSQASLLAALTPAQRKQFLEIMRRIVGLTPKDS
jgi:DNA-binding MarR family transcriptional regulator